MVVARVRVTSAIAGTELLPWMAVPCVELAKHVLTALGARPSRPVTLFREGASLFAGYALSLRSSSHGLPESSRLFEESRQCGASAWSPEQLAESSQAMTTGVVGRVGVRLSSRAQ